MEKKLSSLLILSLACNLVESAPNRLEDLKFEDYEPNESYDTEKDYSKFLDDDVSDKGDASKIIDDIKSKVNLSGFKKQYSEDRGINTKHNIDDLKKFTKSGSLHDDRNYYDDAVYSVSKGISGKAVGITGEEDRKYKKGTKTRGYHRVQHKDEYKKDKEFYDDDKTSGVIKKTGVKGFGFGVSAGKEQNKYRYHNDRDKELVGEQSYFDKGNSNKEYDRHANTKGFDYYFNNE
ncbi:uncharacterized protein [Battus philenor]|uniref:uncharacterized protein n=1 Tax=Battus philenor TaxID=42288 RepID=UPI0035D04C06